MSKKMYASGANMEESIARDREETRTVMLEQIGDALNELSSALLEAGSFKASGSRNMPQYCGAIPSR